MKCKHCGLRIRRRPRDPSVWEHAKNRATWCYNSTVAEPAEPEGEESGDG